jgi:hypothetical protein
MSRSAVLLMPARQFPNNKLHDWCLSSVVRNFFLRPSTGFETCVYRKPTRGRSGDEVRQGSRVN